MKKYTLQEVKKLLIKEIEETQQGTMHLLEDNPDDNSLLKTYTGLIDTRENLTIILDNLIENEL